MSRSAVILNTIDNFIQLMFDAELYFEKFVNYDIISSQGGKYEDI